MQLSMSHLTSCSVNFVVFSVGLDKILEANIGKKGLSLSVNEKTRRVGFCCYRENSLEWLHLSLISFMVC